MQLRNIFLLIIFIHSLQTNSFSCRHLFQDQYFYFLIPNEMPDISYDIKSKDIDQQIKQKVITNPCSQVEIPKECGKSGQAKAVVIETKEDQSIECIIIQNKDWIWSIENNDTEEKEVIKVRDLIQDKVNERVDINNQEDEFHFEFEFSCRDSSEGLPFDINYVESKKTLKINSKIRSECGINFTFIKILDQYYIFSAIIFVIIGCTLCFFGYKLYHNMMSVFLPLLIGILGFYLYMSYVEQSSTHNSKIFTSVLVLIAIMIVISLTVFFANFIFILIGGLVSYKAGLILHTFLQKKYEFFQNDYTEYIIIAIIFIFFLLIFYKLKDYFIIFTTATLGSSFIILSFHYFKLTEFDFLFELEFSKFKDFQNLETQYINFMVIFIVLILIGAFIQIQYLMPKKQSQMDIELNFKN